MKPVVVDASVVAAAFFTEKHTKAARAVLLSRKAICSPDLVYAEVASVIWKRYGRGEIDRKEATELLDDVLALPLDITPSERLAAVALELALHTGRTVYDCLYVALAVQKETVVISGDQRLVNALSVGPLRNHITPLGE